ncbi:1542_t:CDS:2, partial [Acaulospora colombiana]
KNAKIEVQHSVFRDELDQGLLVKDRALTATEKVHSMTSLGGPTTLRTFIPVLTPRGNPRLVSQVLQHQIPNANLTTSNFISNNNALSPLIEILATTTPSMHGRAVFQFIQEHEMGALMDHYRTTFLYHLFLTPSSTDLDIPTIVAAFWLALEPAERRDWEELARDICG